MHQHGQENSRQEDRGDGAQDNLQKEESLFARGSLKEAIEQKIIEEIFFEKGRRPVEEGCSQRGLPHNSFRGKQIKGEKSGKEGRPPLPQPGGQHERRQETEKGESQE